MLCVLSAATVYLISRDGHESCPTTMQFESRTYDAVTTADEVPEGSVLGDGTEHGCGHAGRWSQVVSLAEIPGVDPQIALATPTAGHVLYLSVGSTEEDLPDQVAELIGQP